jgi:hypothetical protein
VPGKRTSREVTLDPGVSADTRARDPGPGGSLPLPDAGYPLHRGGGHDGGDEDQGAEREWKPRKQTTFPIP